MAVSQNVQAKDKQIVEFIPYVKHIASRVAMGKKGHVEYEDLVSCGIIGLIDAANKFDCEKGVKFSTYAAIRIKGAILDEIRKISPLSKNAQDKLSKYNKALEKLQNNLYREPTSLELAKELNTEESEIFEVEESINYLSAASLDDLLFSEEDSKGGNTCLEDETSPDPLKTLEENEKLEYLKKGLEKIREKDRIFLSLYFVEELTLREIGQIYNISESRVCQINSRAVLNLKNAIKSLKYDFKE